MATNYRLKEYDRITGNELNSYTANKDNMKHELQVLYSLSEEEAGEWLDSLEGNKKMMVPCEDIDIVLIAVEEDSK